MDPGDFAVRGGLLDVFPMGADTPLRVELLDEDIDSIRVFDPESQRSLDKVEAVKMLPGREVPMDDASVERVLACLRERFDVDTRRSALYQDLKSGLAPSGIEYYLPMFFAKTATLFDYLDKRVLPVIATGVSTAADTFWAQAQNRYEQRRHDIERPLPPPDELYQSPDALRERLNKLARIEVWASDHARIEEAAPLGDQPLPPLPVAAKDAPAGQALASFLSHYPGRVLVAADSAGRREALMEVLAAAQLKPEVVADVPAFLAGTLRFGMTVAPLEDGFALDQPQIALLTERQLFPERANQPRRTRRVGREPEAIIRDLGELSEGAPIVHEDHGVGRYRGLIVLDAGGMPGEFLEIEYAKGDRLYVPVAQLHLISRYSGASAETAPLHSLGGEQWTKAKRKAAEKVRDVAAELLEIQARRRARAGLALQVDRAMYEPFAAGFPFEETADQLAAIDATLRDLGSSQPMDRVVCGDVGFGKTEVAVRAAFAAASAGKQVAVLVPTTLLAEQHYRNFRDRFADYPMKVEVLSRFKSTKEIKAELEKVASGDIDVIIGTHRLLQPDVKFKDLGLVVVDEEQRFGVRQKEALKAMRANVHLLTLTATPIPRTLNMAMAGLRDLSIIATPPPNRLAVQTFITAWDNTLLREAFQRELSRGGQLYFLHNDVESIVRMQRDLSELVPEARIGIAHGQMPERELERVMLDFQKQRFNVLLSTTIIESGIDIPNANTIIINRADRFGLAQLHQLRGRVGRSHHRAYAYLVVPDRRAMTSDAEKAPGSDRLHGRARRRLHPGHARSGNPRCRRIAGRRPERPDGRGRFQPLYRIAGARGAQHPPGQAARPGCRRRSARRRCRTACGRADSRGLSARRAYAPDLVQAHFQRTRSRSAARTAGRDDRPLRFAAGSGQAPVRHCRAQAAGQCVGRAQAGSGRKRRPAGVRGQADDRPDDHHPDDPETAEDLHDGWPGQAAHQTADARRRGPFQCGTRPVGSPGTGLKHTGNCRVR